MFKLWSESNPKAQEKLKPNLWMRSWNDLDSDDKLKIWKYLEHLFFNKDKKIGNYDGQEYDGYWEKWEIQQRQLCIGISIISLNERYKHYSYGKRTLQERNIINACDDFFDLFQNWDEDVVIEILSLYWKVLISQADEWIQQLKKYTDETDDEYNARITEYQFKWFDEFSSRLNEVFQDFWINVILTRQGFIPKQWEVITEKIYKPTLDFLSGSKYKEVNRDLWDAFKDYHRKDFSGCITKTVSAIQAFLQISANWTIWKWDIADLIREAIKKQLIPDDIFTRTIFDNLKSIIMQERQVTADAHPKKEYANEQNARLILNLAMVFIQHFIQLQK